MKTKLNLLLAFVALMALSCTQDPLQTNEDIQSGKQQESASGHQDPDNPNLFVGGVPLSFSAAMDEEESVKSTISGNTVSWESGDAISVLWTGGRNVATTSDSGASASFTCNVDAEAAGGVYYAVCPATVSCEVPQANTINVTVPSKQDGTFTSANINVAKTTATSFAFKSVGNLVSFTITNPDVTKVTIFSYDNSPLAGKCAVDVSGSVPSLGDYTETSGEIEVTVKGAGTYYAVVLPGTHAEGLLFAPETATANCRAAFAEKSFSFVRKGNTAFGAIEDKVRDLYVSASGTGKGLTDATAMSPADFQYLLNQPKDGEEQDDVVAFRHYRLLAGNTIHILDNITIDCAKVEFTGGVPRACAFTVKGASASTSIAPTGTDRMFRFSNNTDVTFEDLTLTGANLASGNGGAILIENGSNGIAKVTCSNVTFSGNAAAGNAGAVAINAYGKPASFTATGCTFTGNTATSNGGAFYQSASNDSNAGNSTSTFTNCTFTSNSAAKGGVAQVYRGTANFGEGNTFTLNSSTSDGGVFYLNGTADKSVINITGGTFGGASLDEANDAAGANGGGVIYKEGGNLTASNATFKYNTASANNGGVCAVRNNTGAATFTSCTFSYNKATKNGGVLYFTNGGAATLNNCKADHNSAVTGGVAQVYKGTLNVDGSDSEYKQNTASSDAGCIYLNNADATLNIGQNTASGYIRFFQNTATYGGALEMETGAGKFNVSRAEFDANKASNKGGAIIACIGTMNISDCRFLNNQTDEGGKKTASDTKNDGTGGGICVQGASTVVNVNDCYFENNIAGKKDNTDSKCYGGALSLKEGTLNCTNCDFYANKGNRGAVLFMIGGLGGKFTADRCIFRGNKIYSRGVCYVLAKNLAFFNRCSFYDNTLRGTSSAWGVICQTAANAAVCFNNCSMNCPGNGYTSNVQMINADAHILLTNNTMIGEVVNGVVRTVSTGSFSAVGNVMINTTSGQNSIVAGSNNASWYEEYNITGSNDISPHTISTTSKEDVAGSTFTWATDWYTWAGPASLSFTAPTKDQVTAAYDNFAVDASGWGGSLTSITNVGSTFKSWLESLDPVGYNVNQHGDARSGSYWPGSYQN